MVAKGSESARVLIYDIENTPITGLAWGKRDVDILKVTQDWWMLCFAYKWLGDDSVTVVSQPQFRKEYKADKTDDFRVVQKLHQLFSEADVIVAHNGNSFDQRKTNARFLFHGFDPPSHYHQIDTYLVSKRHFNLTSHRLGDLGEYLGLGSKADSGGMATWIGCMAGDKTSWATMTYYNGIDTELLEKVYLRLRPWINNHPNVAVLNGKPDACPKCGSDKLIRQGFKYAKTTTRQQWQCTSCRGWSSSRVATRTVPPSLIN